MDSNIFSVYNLFIYSVSIYFQLSIIQFTETHFFHLTLVAGSSTEKNYYIRNS